MAITKIHAIKATVHKAVDYICDPAKTDESILISSFGCSPETAAYDFKFALSKTSQADTNKAFHLIQSFMPSEVSYKEAHQIGVELADKNSSSWKTKLKNDIDEAIQTADTYEDFLDLIRAKGYEIKGETFGENDLKYISFRPLDRERFARGSVKSLGAEYTRERIKERIEAKALEQSQKRVPFPRKAKPIIKDYSSKKLIDTSEEKFTQSPGLKHWADIQNLKIAAASYSGAGSIAELEKQLAAKSALAKTARNSLVETEHQLKNLGQILKYAEQYKANHIYHVRYQKSKDQDAYLRRHETELLLHDGAENMLKRFGIDLKNLDVEKLRSDYNALYSKKETLQNTYKSAEKEINALNRKLDNLKQYLDRDSQDHQTSDRKAERNQNTL